MTTADLLFEAASTAVSLGWALLAWIAVLAALCTATLLGTLAVTWWACRTLWRRLRPRTAARTEYRAVA
ncbi:hypothetical protein GTY23_23205 [Streptomyces sp. SID5998]|nr:hypothetical protein [Streptomyces sp. SID5998]